MAHIIRDFDALATTVLRRDALSIAEAAYDAIDTEKVIRNKLSVNGSILSADDVSFDLSMFRSVKLIGFGKASCKAMRTVEALLREHVRAGLAIDVKPGTCEVTEITQGSHPLPSPGNVETSGKIVRMAREATAEDLVIVLVSGGGSSLLCWPYDECEQGARLYADFMRVGAPIEELNLVRRHISEVKGGGLAALLHPATVLSLVFCDVPGDRFEDVASGPTYFDPSTIADAQNILQKYGLSGYVLRETPKDRSLFARVRNVELVSNKTALESMRRHAETLGYRVEKVGDSLYDEPTSLVDKMRAAFTEASAAIAGGEPRIAVKNPNAKGGRCQYVSLSALKNMAHEQVFISIASDGTDNSAAAGALADMGTIERAARAGLDIHACLENFDSYDLFEQTGDLFFTGPTDANVSDLYVYLRKI